MTTKHKYDELVQSMIVLGQQTAHCHAQATRLGLTKTVQWLNDVAHENGRRMNLLMTDIESTLIGNELDAADALKGYEPKYHTSGPVPHNAQLEHYASLATQMSVTNLTAGMLPPPTLGNLKRAFELLKTLTPPDVPLGEGLFGKPDMFNLSMSAPMLITDPFKIGVKISTIVDEPDAFDDNEPCKFCGARISNACETAPPDLCEKALAHAFNPQPKPVDPDKAFFHGVHDCYTNYDEWRPAAICDRNGQVVLAQCKRCGKAEAELIGAECTPIAQCTRSDQWNCKYCDKVRTCEAVTDARNFGKPKQPTPPTEGDTK